LPFLFIGERLLTFVNPLKMTNMTTTMTKKESALNQHYWYNTGVYQQESERMFSELVPKSDKAPTIHGELNRCISRLYYDYCNNGNCNALEVLTDDCSHCDGTGYDDEEETHDCEWCGGDCTEETGVEFDSYYGDMVDFLKMFMQDKEVIFALEDWLLEGKKRYSFSDEEMSRYDKVVDAVVFQCLTTENKPNPFYPSSQNQ
jgi:hypothetical protein